MDTKERMIVIFLDFARFMQDEAKKLDCEMWEVRNAVTQYLQHKGDKK